jgi:hypothetical protein
MISIVAYVKMALQWPQPIIMSVWNFVLPLLITLEIGTVKSLKIGEFNR